MEYFEIIDYPGKTTGKKKLRNRVHTDGDWHRASHIHLVNPVRKTIFFQQRSPNKLIAANLIDAAVGGHHTFGEDETTVVQRETLEEVGLDLQHHPGELVRIGGYHIGINEDLVQGIQDYELRDVHIFVADLSIETFSLQQEELFAILEFRNQDVLDLFLDRVAQIQNVAGRRFNTDGELVDYIHYWSKADFVPSPDNYFGKVAAIVKRIYQGEREFPGI